MTAVAEKKVAENANAATVEQNAKPDQRARREVMRRPETAFASITAFENAQRMAIALSKSDLVPTQYSENVPNCLLALEMSQRLGMNPLMVMQNMYIVHNRPAWSSQFMIACINGSGHFSPLRYELSGKENTDTRTCVAWAYDLATGERLESPAVSIAMAKKEGWYERNGSKWKTLPELMLRYRTATFFGRTYCPELTMGMNTVEEVHDIGEAVVVEDDPLAPGRHERKRSKKADASLPEPTPEEKEQADERRAELKAQVEEPETQEREPGEDDEPEADHSPEAGNMVAEDGVDPDACADYRELCKAQKRTPRFMEKAIEAAREKHDECGRVKEFCNIDHTDEIQCGLILTEYRRVHDLVKGK
jgi:hypothetical protein